MNERIDAIAYHHPCKNNEKYWERGANCTSFI